MGPDFSILRPGWLEDPDRRELGKSKFFFLEIHQNRLLLPQKHRYTNRAGKAVCPPSSLKYEEGWRPACLLRLKFAALRSPILIFCGHPLPRGHERIRSKVARISNQNAHAVRRFPLRDLRITLPLSGFPRVRVPAGATYQARKSAGEGSPRED